MPKINKKLFAWVLAFAVLTTAVFALGFAVYAESTGNVIDLGDDNPTPDSGNGWSFAKLGSYAGIYTVTGDVTITGSTGTETDQYANIIKIAPGANVKVTLDNVTIITAFYCAFDMDGSATVELTIIGDNTLMSGSARAGIQVPQGSSLIINGGETDSLTVTGGDNSAGIGGGTASVSSGSSCGSITINGGAVTAYGGSYSAGIGGGYGKPGGNIAINGGTVNAFGGKYGAGIGGGIGQSGGIININGGTVKATGGDGGAGIGGGTSGEGGNITIEAGAKIAAVGGSASNYGGAGIGSGGISSSASPPSGNILIDPDAEVTATGGIGTAYGNGANVGGGGHGYNGTHNYDGDMYPGYYTITAAAGPNGTIAPSGNVIAVEGYNKNFIITPDSGYAVASVTVDGEVAGVNNSYRFINITEAHAIEAAFCEKPDEEKIPVSCFDRILRFLQMLFDCILDFIKLF